MKLVRALQFGVVLILLDSANILQAKPDLNYSADLGIAIEQSGRACLEIRNSDLANGHKIQFVNSDSQPTTGEAEIVRRVDQGCTSTGHSTPGLSHYELRVVRGTLAPSTPAFALVDFSGPLTVKDTFVTGDLDGDGHVEAFRSCTSSEGVHLTVWKGPPLRGTRKWHYYYYLGYDVEPSCTKRDTKPGNR